MKSLQISKWESSYVSKYNNNDTLQICEETPAKISISSLNVVVRAFEEEALRS